VLIGSAIGRARLREALADAAIEVVGEAPTLADARAADLEADACLIALGEYARGTAPDDLGEPLTRREIQVVALLAEGLPNNAIGARLGISDQTVKFHVSSICGKLGAANRTEAVRLAARRGVIAL